MIYSARPQQPKPESRSFTDRSSLLRIHRPTRSKSIEAPVAEKKPNPPDLALAKQILARIESRLPTRVRHLTVYMTGSAVVLTGECSTFYTKQLAQHIAMGVLEYEQLINNIDVSVTK